MHNEPVDLAGQAQALLDRLAAAETENNQLYHACEGLKEQLADAKAEQEKNDG